MVFLMPVLKLQSLKGSQQEKMILNAFKTRCGRDQKLVIWYKLCIKTEIMIASECDILTNFPPKWLSAKKSNYT